MGDLNDKYIAQEDSLFNINNNLGNLKVNLNETNVSLENTRREQDQLLERIEKLE